MKLLVGLVSAVTLAGFCWFSWYGMHAHMSASLAERAKAELAKHKIDGITITFDHLDGLVSGARTPDERQEVREILADRLPLSRLVFIDQMSTPTDLSYPDTTRPLDKEPDALGIYAKALVDSEASIQQGLVRGTDLSFADETGSQTEGSENTGPSATSVNARLPLFSSTNLFAQNTNKSATAATTTSANMIETEDPADQAYLGQAPADEFAFNGSVALDTDSQQTEDETSRSQDQSPKSEFPDVRARLIELVADVQPPKVETFAIQGLGTIELTDSSTNETETPRDDSKRVPAEESEDVPGKAQFSYLSNSSDTELPPSSGQTVAQHAASALIPEPLEESRSPQTRNNATPVDAANLDLLPLSPTSQPVPRTNHKARLGVYMTTNANDSVVRMIDAGSAADKSGIRVGDRIVQIGTQRVTAFEELENAVAQHFAGDVVRIWIEREGTRYVVETRLQGTKNE